MTEQEQIAELAAQWQTNISDPPVSGGLLFRLLSRYGHAATAYAMDKTIKRYHKGGIDFDGSVNYLCSTTRKQCERDEAAKAFKPPTAWLAASD